MADARNSSRVLVCWCEFQRFGKTTLKLVATKTSNARQRQCDPKGRLTLSDRICVIPVVSSEVFHAASLMLAAPCECAYLLMQISKSWPEDLKTFRSQDFPIAVGNNLPPKAVYFSTTEYAQSQPPRLRFPILLC